MNVSLFALSNAATLATAAAGGGLALILLAILIFRAMWKVPEPNQALLVSGRHHQSDSGGPDFGFRIVVGRGVLVVPGVQVVRRLNLDLKEAELQVECVTSQGIPVGVRGVVIFKVGDDHTSIANGARRFLDQEDQMETRVHNVFAGHLRSIVGGLTVEEMIRDRARLTSETRDSSASELEKLGLIIDSLQIHEIEDPTGYIQNLARPYAAAVASQARIAQASADREATQREQGFFFDDPFDGFAFGKLHGLSDGRGKVDVPLFAGFTVDELDFGGETHAGRSFQALSSHITRYQKRDRITT